MKTKGKKQLRVHRSKTNQKKKPKTIPKSSENDSGKSDEHILLINSKHPKQMLNNNEKKVAITTSSFIDCKF